MLPDRVSNPGPVNYESGALPIALRVPALGLVILGYIESNDSVLQTCWIVSAPLRLESESTDGRMDTRIDVGKI